MYITSVRNKKKPNLCLVWYCDPKGQSALRSRWILDDQAVRPELFRESVLCNQPVTEVGDTEALSVSASLLEGQLTGR